MDSGPSSLRTTASGRPCSRIMGRDYMSLSRNLSTATSSGTTRAIEPRAPVFQADIDAWLSGGMDEAIPTGHVSTYRGETYPYLGEVWSLRWDYDITSREPEMVEVHLWRMTPISPLRVDRWVSIRRGEPIIRMRHRVRNLANSSFDFLWGLHPCWDVGPATRFDLPAGEMLIEELSPGNRLGEKGTRYTWPHANEAATGRQIDMRWMPAPTSGFGEFQFATQLDAGWLAVTDAAARSGAGLVFPKDVFPAAWLWTCAGGWRGYHVAALEAWTGYPPKAARCRGSRRVQHAAGRRQPGV